MIPWTRTCTHNLPLINGVEQSFGAEYRAELFDASEDRITVSFPAAYPKQAGVKALTRTLELTNDRLLVTDHFDFVDEKRQTVSEILMCVLPVQAEGNAVVLDGRYRISASVGTVKCERVPFEDASLEASWKIDFVTRIVLECEGQQEICIKVEKI